VPAVVRNDSRLGQPLATVLVVVLDDGVVVDDEELVLVVRLVLVVLATVLLDVLLFATVLVEVLLLELVLDDDVLGAVLDVTVVPPGQRQLALHATNDPPGLDGGQLRLPGGSQPSPPSSVPLPHSGAVLELVDDVVVTVVLAELVDEVLGTVVVVLAPSGHGPSALGRVTLKVFAPGATPLRGRFAIFPPAMSPNATQ
jgi:hypothetical protein